MLDTSGQQCPLSFFTPPELLHSVMNGSQYISRRTAETFDWSVAAVPAKREYVLSEITANVAQRLGSNIQITGHTFLRTTLQDPSFDWSVAAVPAKREYVLSEITANVAQRLGSNIQITGHTFLRTTLQDPSFVIKQIDEFSLGITGAHHLFSVRITPPGSFINQVTEVVEVDGCSIQVIYMVLMHSPDLAVCYCRYIKNGSADSITVSADHIPYAFARSCCLLLPLYQKRIG